MSVLRINIILFGIGNVGSALIQQVLKNQLYFLEKYRIELRFPIITSSNIVFFENETVINTWKSNLSPINIPFRIESIIDYTRKQGFENLIAVDASSGSELVRSYISLIKNGFNIVTANNTANIVHQDFYNEIRRNLKKFDKAYFYETNINTGKEVLNTLQGIQLSNDKIIRIRATFSNSLSYIFNRFGNEEIAFSSILEDAEKLGYTKTDSREDLSGKEVAEKLLIIARELAIEIELKEIKTHSLVLPNLNKENSKSEYNKNKKLFDEPYRIAKTNQSKNHVLRYVGEIDLEKNTAEVKLISEPITSPIGQLKETENTIEIYTEKNALKPILIQGNGTGKETAAKTLLKDILKVQNILKQKRHLLQLN